MIRCAALLAAALLIAAPAHAGARQDATVLMSENAEERAFQERYGYSDAVITGDTVYLSGVVAGRRTGEATLEPAYARAFEKLTGILKRAGVGWDDVVEMTTYHTDVIPQLAPLTEVKARYIKAPYPAWTAISVSRLVPDGGVTEIKLIAKRPAGAPAR